MPRYVTLAVLLCAGSTLTAADWPQWRGPNRDGVSAETGLLKAWPKGGPKLLWQADIGGVGYGSPAVVGGKVYIAGATDNKDGKSEFVTCFSAADGKQVWKTDVPESKGGYLNGWGTGPRSTPTLDGGALYHLGARGELLRLKAADGKQEWAVNLPNDFTGGIPSWGYSESVLIDGDALVCTPGGKKGAVLALDKKTGKQLWRCTDLEDGAGYSSLVPIDVGGVRQYVTQTQAAAVSVRAKDGALLWRKDDLKRAVAVIPTPIVHKNMVFFTAGYGAGCELFKLASKDDKTTAETVYTKNKLVSNQHGGMVRVGDHVYGHTDAGNKWVCFLFGPEPEDLLWESKQLDKGSISAAGGYLYCYGQQKGTCVLVEATPKEWTETGRLELPAKSQFPRGGGMIWAHPVIADGKLYLRDHELLFCFDVSAK
jgi:outer membrane protein assembly factor BamB